MLRGDPPVARPTRPASEAQSPRKPGRSGFSRAQARTCNKRTASRDNRPEPPDQAVNGLQLPFLNATPTFQALVIVLNGTITNDKFCMSRMGRLHLTWWRLPLRARIPVTNQIEYPTDVNEMKCCHQEGTHEETEVQHPASHERDCRCATTVGSSLPVSYPMEQRVPEGGSSRAYSTGEQQ